MFAPSRDGAALALLLLDLSGERDARIQRRLDVWLHAIIALLPEIETGDHELDQLPFDEVLAALMIQHGARHLTPTGSASGLLHAMAVINKMQPSEALRMVRAALEARSHELASRSKDQGKAALAAAGPGHRSGNGSTRSVDHKLDDVGEAPKAD